jgi:hypothetical protein
MEDGRGQKSQGPNPKEIPRGQKQKIPKIPRRFLSFPNLVIGFSLGFGVWDLEFLAHARRPGWITSIVFAHPVP